MSYLSKADILQRLGQRAERDYESIPLGGTVRLRELSRADRITAAQSPTNEATIPIDRWHLCVIAFGVIDPGTHAPLFAPDELLPLMEGDAPALRAEAAADLAQAILDLSEVGPDYLKSGDPVSDTGRGD